MMNWGKRTGRKKMKKLRRLLLLGVWAAAALLLNTPAQSGTDGSLKWQYYASSSISSSPTLGPDGTIYFGTYNGANSAAVGVKADGTLKGSFSIPASIDRSTLAFGADGTVYFGATNGIVYAIKSVGGALQWSYATGGNVGSSPAVGADGTVYFGADNGNLYAVKNGALLWSIPHGSNECSPAIGANGTIYAGDAAAGYFNAVNPDGSIKWSYFPLTASSSPAIARDGTIYVGSYNSALYALKADGTLKWLRLLTSGAYIYSSPAIGPDGTIYVGSNDQRLYAVNPDGTIKWSYLTGGQIWSSPAVGASGVIYVGSGDGNLHAVNPADGSKRWTYPIGSGAFASYPSPVIGPDGVVYVTSWDQNLYAIYTDCGGPASSSWPMFHRDARRTGRFPLTLTGFLVLMLGG